MFRSLPASLLLLGAVNFAAPAAADWSGTIRVDENGVTHVDNPAAPIESPSEVSLDAAWTIGGDTDNDDEFFGVINQIRLDGDGNVYLLDAQLSAVKVFSPDGEFLREFGREGEGPGEFRGASDMFFLPGGTIGVLQVAPGRIVQFGTDGSALGDHPVPKSEGGGFTGYINGRSVDESLILACFSMSFAEQKMTQVRYIAAIDADGNETTRYHSEDRLLDLANPVLDEAVWDTFDQRWTAGPDGRVYAVPRSGDYTIRVWAPDGTLEHEIHREEEPLMRDEEEMARVKRIYEAFLVQMPNAEIKLNDTHRTVESIEVREDGTLWVLTSRGIRDRADIVGTFDVFDAEGRFTKQVTVNAPSDPLKDRVVFGGDRMFVVSGWMDGIMAMQGAAAGAGDEDEAEEEAEPMAVTCYRLDDSRVALN